MCGRKDTQPRVHKAAMSEAIFGKYKLVLGLEIHLHLKTKRKMFCRCDADVYGKEPNTHTCPTCLGLPGALPIPNPSAIRKTQILGLALNSEISKNSRFDRKHYFYPDLPKGYQISQYKQPLCVGGYLELDSGQKAEIERVHLEEDTAKSMHEGGKTLVDFNLSSMPLVEIVTKPIFTSIEDAVEFSKVVQVLVRDLGIGDANMEKGQMRLEPNISLRTLEMEEKGELPDYKVEIKNINSFRFMEKAVTAEVIRQRELLNSGESPTQENRGYNEAKKTTVSQRSKEEAHDYRYFPEPDIPPMEFDAAYIKELEEEFKKVEENLVKPDDLKGSLKDRYGLAENIIESIIDLSQGVYAEAIKQLETLVESGLNSKEVANMLVNRPDYRNITPKEFSKKLENEKDKVSDEGVLTEAIKDVLDKNQDAVQSYKVGKENALQFLIGMVMRDTKGKADAQKVKELLLDQIKN